MKSSEVMYAQVYAQNKYMPTTAHTVPSKASQGSFNQYHTLGATACVESMGCSARNGLQVQLNPHEKQWSDVRPEHMYDVQRDHGSNLVSFNCRGDAGVVCGHKGCLRLGHQLKSTVFK
jgi:hypothetical protein